MQKAMLMTLMLHLYFVATALAGYVYDEKKGTILVGGYPIEGPRREISGTATNLVNKLYLVSIDGKARLYYNPPSSIDRYEMSISGYVAVNRGDYKLDILSLDGTLIKSFNNVIPFTDRNVFSWSPDGKKIAFIESSKTEGIVSSISTGVYIYNIESETVDKIYKHATEINWSRHNGNIYIRDTFGTSDTPKYYIYEPTSNTINRSIINAIFYSDTGKYAIIEKYDPEGSRYFIYSIQENIILTKGEDVKYPIYSLYYGFGFLAKNDYIYEINESPGYIIYDATIGKKVYSKRKTSLIGWDMSVNRGVTYAGGDKITIVDLLTGKELFDVNLPK